MDVLNVGVIGLGTFGQVHLQAYDDHPAVRLSAVCDLDEGRLREAGRRYGVEALFADPADLLALDEVDAVSVVTPDFTHTEIVLEAVQRGKAVLVEKPLATTLEDCDRIGEALRACPVPFMVDFHNRWNPGVVRIREAVEGGETGDVRMVYFRLSDTIYVPTEMLSWAGRSSVSWFLGSHCVDALRWMLGEEVTRVYALSDSRVLKGLGVDTADYCLGMLEFARGARAVVENCWILPRSRASVVDFKLEVVGEKGALYFDPTPERLLRLGPEGVSCPDTYAALRVHGRSVGFAVESIRHFADCVLEGREPAVGFEDGRQATRVVLAMEESARTGQPVEL
jgi:predicted dehydrogenase